MTEQSRGPTRGARSGLTGIAIALLALFVTASPATLSGQTIDEFSIPTSDSGVWGITAGPDGALWFIENHNHNKIGRITTAGVVTESPRTDHRPPVPRSGARSLRGTRGACWRLRI